MSGIKANMGFTGELGVTIKRAGPWWRRLNPWRIAADFLRSIWL